MPQYDLSTVRTQLITNGYQILPNKGKVPIPKGWNTRDFLDKEQTPERVGSWSLRFPDMTSIGLLVADGIVVFDLDIDDAAMIDELVTQLPEDVLERGPTRYGKGAKIAVFARLAEGEEDFVRLASHRYGEHCVEVFGGKRLKSGKASRQFGVYGEHSEGIEYQWAEGVPALHQIKASDLPAVTLKQIHGFIDCFEASAADRGWQPTLAPATDNASAVYDITEQSRFDTDRGGTGISYEELCEAQTAYGELRCASNFIPGRVGIDPARCWVFWSKRHDCVGVYVYGDEATHYPAEYAPEPDPIQEELEALRQLVPVPIEAPPRPGDAASVPDKALWLGFSYGYCALNDTVIELFKPADDCQLKPPAFQRLYRAWREAIKGKKGAIKYAYATAYWEVNPARLDIEGVRMRPDMPFPVYTEADRKFKNTYLRPRHQGCGEIQPWLDYMVHLIPDQTEREWFCNWLAHKHLHPGVPGVAVIMVATGPDGPVYGAGRGILRDIVARLLGPRYVRPIDFDIFTGKSAQGAYTDWGAYATLVTVNEAKDTPDSGRWTERRAVYERLREIVDPRAIERTFIKKGQQAFSGLSFASYLVFSNNRDALQIPDGDRRIAAIANGGRMSPEMAAGLQAWMEQPGNIAELARWLEARDLTQFDAYAPPITETKTTMQELARSELDDAFDAVRRRIGPQRLFTGEQIRAAMMVELNDFTLPDPTRRWIMRQIRAEATNVGGFKMPPVQGRHRILGWRGVDYRLLIGDSVTAQKSVDKTAIVLNDLTSVTVTWPGTGPGDSG